MPQPDASRLRAAGLALAACLMAPDALAAPRELRFTFVGNMAFHVTDGERVLLSDFPYESGYSQQVAELGARIDARKVVVYHQAAAEAVPDVLGRVQLRQGEGFRLTARER